MMAINTHTHVRQLLLACLIILMMVSPGCKQQASRPPLSADEVKTLASEIKRLSSDNIQAWNNHDDDLMHQLYTNDIMYYETGRISYYHGIENVIYLSKESVGADLDASQTGIFIGREDGFDIWEMNYWTEFGFSKENPAIAYSWYTLREGKISSWYLFWDSTVFTAQKLDFTQKPLLEYATAWSSNDPEAVASLYDPKVVRIDSLFGENQQGSTAVKEFATDYFAWYPGVRLELLKSFELYQSYPVRIGGVYAIHVSDKAGQSCDVSAIILLDLTQDMITNEWLFYNADSLIACGWAQ
jgi:outer membrane murein-binding lipoprotein Lpp